MENEKNERTTPWTHFGEVFLKENLGYTQVPKGLYPVLDRMGFKMGRDRVVICLVRRLRPGVFRVFFRHDELAAEANVSRRTVHTVLKQMVVMNARVINSGDQHYTRISCWDLMGFIAKVAEIYEEMQRTDADFEKFIQDGATP